MEKKKKINLNKILCIEKEKKVESRNNKIFKGKGLELYKRNLVLSELQREVLIGTLLGDATIPKQKNNTNYNIKFEQSKKNEEYVQHLYMIFKDWVGTEPKIREIKCGGTVDRQSVWFRTYRHKAFTFYYNVFYFNGKKIIPKLLHRYLTPRVLAYWFMDDGSKEKNGYRLHTQGFTFYEIKYLCKILQNFDLNVYIHFNKKSIDGNDLYILYISGSESIYIFDKLVSPYILDCFKYKLHCFDIK